MPVKIDIGNKVLEIKPEQEVEMPDNIVGLIKNFSLSAQKAYTQSQLLAMTEKQQEEILKSMGLTEFPKLEQEKIKLILEKQKGG